MRYVYIIGAIVVGLVVLIAIIGALLPRDHVATVTATIPASADDVWTAITNVEAFPSWRTDVQRVQVAPPQTSPKSWREYSRHGAVTMAVDISEPPRRLVVRIADKDLPFGGAWEYELGRDGADVGKTRLTITERGYVSNPIFRFVSRFVMGHYGSLEAYTKSLGRKFGADVTSTRV